MFVGNWLSYIVPCLKTHICIKYSIDTNVYLRRLYIFLWY